LRQGLPLAGSAQLFVPGANFPQQGTVKGRYPVQPLGGEKVPDWRVCGVAARTQTVPLYHSACCQFFSVWC